MSHLSLPPFLEQVAQIVDGTEEGSRTNTPDARSDSGETTFERAKRLRQEGAYEEAAAQFTSLLDQSTTGDATASIALAAAESYLAAGANESAATMAARALESNPAGVEARMVQAEALLGLGQPGEARGLFEQATSEGLIGGYAAFRAAEVAAGDEYPVAARQLYGRAIELGVNKWWEAAAARRIGRSYLAAGEAEEAISWLRRAEGTALAIGQRGIPVWFDGELVRRNSEARRAPVLLDLARAQRQSGLMDAAAATYASIVKGYPSTTEANDALGALTDLGAADQVSAYEKGLVLFNNGRPVGAIDAFTADLASTGPPDAGTVRYYLALARRNSGDVVGAIDGLTAMARVYPRHDLSPDALWQVARLTEARGSAADKVAAYLAVADAFPQDEAATKALLRIGSLSLESGDEDVARSVWDRLGHSGASSVARAQGLFWLGRAFLGLGNQDEGQANLRDAVAAAPFSFEGIRAQDLAERGRGAEPFERRWGLRMDPTPRDDAVACADWIATWAGTDVPVDVARALPRIDKLISVGLISAALAEALEASSPSGIQPYDLYRLAVGLGERRLYAASIQAALRLGSMSPAGSGENGPPCLQRLVYPVAFPNLVEAEAQRYGLDPLYLTALLRQESWFSSHALSGAQARGMSQIIPDTRRAIAQALGRSGVTDDDLYRPRDAIAFGAFYLDQTYEALGTRPLLGLAGYNAGPGNARRWTDGDPAIDPDIFVEAIDFGETRSYVRLIYQMYARYRSLY